jgi:hypothetical protein
VNLRIPRSFLASDQSSVDGEACSLPGMLALHMCAALAQLDR